MILLREKEGGLEEILGKSYLLCDSIIDKGTLMGKPAVEIMGSICLSTIPTRSEAILIRKMIKVSNTPLVSTKDWHEEIKFKEESDLSQNFIEQILSGKAPLQHPRRTEREIIHGLSSALDTAGKLFMETGLTGQLCDVSDLIWQWHREMVQAKLRNS